MSTREDVITLQGVKRRFRSIEVLRGVNLQVPRGAVYGLLGRNGAGKTTLLKMLMGLSFPDAGTVSILGLSHREHSSALSQRIASVTDVGLLPSWMSVGDAIKSESTFRRFDDARLRRWLASGTVREKQRIRSLSKGQRQLLEFELALGTDAEVLILDEPFDGMDPVVRAEAQENLMALVAERQCTVLLSSHVLADLERLCDRFGVLAGGRLAFETTMDEAKSLRFSQAGGEVTNALGVMTAAEVVASRQDGRGQLRIVRASDSALSPEGTSGIGLHQPSLEELGVELIRCLESESGPTKVAS